LQMHLGLEARSWETQMELDKGDDL
jgi:hypothetical protein